MIKQNYGDGLLSLGIHKSALSTTLPREGKELLREWITNEEYLAEEEVGDNTSFKSLLVYPSRNTPIPQVRKVFNLLAKELYLKLSGGNHGLYLAVKVVPLREFVRMAKDDYYSGINGTIPGFTFIEDAVEGITNPVPAEDMFEVRSFVRSILRQGKAVGILSLVHSYSRIEEWWTPELLNEIKAQGIQFEV